ncbi:SusC/RagA family TonB-linked outer membrane protein [Parapedobacter tibetensis]|uniref:SusC/RagA family TonB-linked outer membrane protein n=1 Tax=Parapedobacter tibetensis TaxID=2972951 RepID=UPI00214DA67E|nr:SusC/RagA family TonB-linked outer membrane protein [Parapedobacter tibetensis]
MNNLTNNTFNMKTIHVIFACVAFLVTGYVQAQTNVTVTGNVIDENRQPLGGVTVLVGKPPRALGTTDENGNFRFTVPANAPLVFRIIGYQQASQNTGSGRTNLRVQMAPDASALEEVVIRGYQKRSKELSTGSSFSLTAKDLPDVPTANIESLLQGRVPGMNIQLNTGAPGFRGSTQIRGLSTVSMTGSGDQSFLQPTSPLYVIDGIPMDADRATEYGFQQQGPGMSPLSLIPQEDIASIEILKDAQATSLYGSMAAYGVIIITTKRGNSPIPRVRYTHNSFVRTPPKLRETLGGNLERQLKLQQIYGNALDYFDIWRISQTGFLSDSLNAYWNNSTNWQDYYYRSRYNQSHNLHIDGGDQLFNYKANLGYFTDQGIIENTGFTRYNANLRMEYQPADRRFQIIGAAFAQMGKQSIGDGVGMLQTGIAENGLSSTLLPPPSFYQAGGSHSSALSTDNDNATRLIRSNLEANYMFIEGLRASTSLSYEFESKTEDTFTPAVANNQFARVYSYNGRTTQLYNRNSLNYSTSLNDSHNLFINFFNEFRIAGRQSSVSRQERSPNDQLQGPIGFDGYYSRGGGLLDDYTDERSASFAFAASYDFQKKYVVDLSYRLDGSSANGFENLYARNPAIGLRWNFDKEAFFENSEWLDYGALRMSWGVNIIPTGTLERIYGRFDITGNYNGQQGIGLDFDQIPNPDLKPKTNTQYNLGLDFSLFNGKIEVIYDTYYKKVENELFEQLLPNTTGFNKLFSNGAGIANYGHELFLMMRPLPLSSDFSLSFSLTGAYNKDVLLTLPEHYGGQFIRWEFDQNEHLQHVILRVGGSTLANYLRINDGVFPTDADVPVDPVTGLRYQTNGVAFAGGDPMLRDLNGDYILDGNDYRRTGNSQPLFTGGASIMLTYKNFNFNLNGSITGKRTILNNALAQRLGLMGNPFGNRAVVPLNDVDMWRQAGDVATYPYAYDYRRYGYIQPFRFDQNLWAEDGSYFKINNIVIGYMFDRDWISRWGLANLRVYVSGENLHTFSRYSGPNPENVTNMGRDVSSGYPVPRTYNLGLSVEF